MPNAYRQMEVPEDKFATEFLANERTFLAWVRTSVAVISLGFVIARFGVWLRELALQIAPQSQRSHIATSLYIGVAMMGVGGLLTVLAARRYHVVNLAIEHGRVSTDRGLVILVTAIVSVLAIAMIAYMVVNASGSLGFC
ncbi:MAG: DUF202 domain-containing protein [Rudaea sp.]